MKNRYKLFLFTPLFMSLLFSCGGGNQGNIIPPEDENPIDPPIQEPEKTEKYRSVDIYCLNDFHGSFTYDKEEGQTGFGRIGKFLKDKKDKNPDDTIILSAGDMWQGGVESNKTKGNIISEAMNIVGFDAMAIGNHEFDWGEEAIKANNEIMNFPLISSNIFYSKDNSRPEYLVPSITLNKNGVKVGIIGAGSKYLGDDILATISKDFVFKDPITYIKQESEKLKEEKCDLILLATHDGGFSGRVFNYSELTKGEDPCVDAIFLGHDHKAKSGSKNDVPYIEAGSNGKYVANIKFDLELVDGAYKVKEYRYENITTFNNSLFESSLELIDSLIEKYKDLIGDINRVIYEFSRSLNRNAFLEIVNTSIAYYLNAHNDKYHTKIQAAFHNSGGIRSDVSSGRFTYKDLIKVCPFNNTLVIMKVNEAQYFEIKGTFGTGAYIPNEVDFSKGYAYVGTINFVSEQDNIYALEKIYTGVVIQDAIEYYLINNPGLY